MATAIESVRVRIGDTDSSIFTDAQIQIFLDEQDEDILLSAADAITAMAASASIVAKLYQTGTITRDRKQVPTRLLEVAKFYRNMASSEPCTDVIEMGHSIPQLSDIAFNQVLRGLT